MPHHLQQRPKTAIVEFTVPTDSVQFRQQENMPMFTKTPNLDLQNIRQQWMNKPINVTSQQHMHSYLPHIE